MSDFINSLKPSLSFSEMDFAELSENVIHNASLDFTGVISNGSLFTDHQDFSLQVADNLPSFSPPAAVAVDYRKPVLHTELSKKRKLEKSAPATDTSSANSSVREDGTKRRKEWIKGGVGSRNSKEGEKQKEVVHVRARRGQATDSHSLAERVRRERINEKMRCLQDLVPGCYKTMGMATMLDEIINYVQSLQNQVEFLSMKLSAASTFYDFNLDLGSVALTQQVENIQSEAMEKLERNQEFTGVINGFNSNFPF